MGRSKAYSNEEIVYLIQAWREYQIMKESGKLISNREMFAVISTNLMTRGFEIIRDPSALEDKLGTIKSVYLKVRLIYLN